MTAQTFTRPPLEAVALDDALDRVRELSLRLWAVREAHPPVRGLLRRDRCGTCGEPFPCRTVLAAGR
ncbi:MAG: hypothetical protein M3P93_07285 [Actinomycetota bacterium]|nr:hypothetical protein [Actinomycetota bacterium]